MKELPDGLHDFLSESGWSDADIEVIPGDASFRRYFRLKRANGQGAMLMHAPPPHEAPVPFLNVAGWLTAHQMRAPEIYASDADAGWVLLEDFGNDRMRDWIDAHPEGEEAAYEAAIDALVELHERPAGPFPAYDMPTLLREAALLTDWYCPAHGLEVDADGYLAAWEEALTPLTAPDTPSVTVLRDYHAENIMLLNGVPGAPQGLIDFRPMIWSLCCKTRAAMSRRSWRRPCSNVIGPKPRPEAISRQTTRVWARSVMLRSSGFSPGSTGAMASRVISP